MLWLAAVVLSEQARKMREAVAIVRSSVNSSVDDRLTPLGWLSAQRCRGLLVLMSWFVLIVSWCALPTLAVAQQGVSSTNGSSLDIVAVKVQGNQRVEARSILAQLRTKPGQKLSRKRISQDLRRLWRLGYFEDIQVDAKAEAGKVVVTFIVKEKPAIASVSYKGNKDLSIDDIKEVVDLTRFQILDVSKVKANAEKIRELYVEKGYYLAEVKYKIKPDTKLAGQSHVTFMIREFAKVQVKKVTFLGNKFIKDEELLKIMSTKPGDWFSFLTSFGNFKEAAFEADVQRLTAYYYDKGFVQVRVGVPTVRLSRDKRFLYITIKLKEGPRFKVGDVDVRGDFITTQKKLRSFIKLKKNKTFSYGTMRQDVQRLRDFYQNAGYAYVQISPLTRVDASRRLVRVDYDIQKGSKVYFGRIEIVGNTKTRDKVVRRELIIEEGKLYSNRALQLSQIRVRRLGFFEKVEITTQRGKRPDIINATVRVAERPTGTFQAGAGFSSAESILANLQVSQRNLFGRGQDLTLQIQWSGLRTLFNLRFSEPYFLDTNLRFSTRLYRFDFLYRDYAEQSTGGNITFGYPIFDRFSGAEDLTAFMTYKLENVVITPGGQTARSSRQIGALFRGGLTSSLQLALAYDSRDNQAFPTKGQQHTARVEVADDTFTGSEAEFVKYDLTSNVFVPLFWQFVLRLHGQVGFVSNIDPRKPVPLQERYLVGGPETIRGFQRFSLGPTRTVAANSGDPGTSASQFIIGGNKQLLLTAEVEFPILTAINLKGVVFADAGNAFGEDQNLTLMPDLFTDNENAYNDALRTAVGLGFRWFSPIGLLRFEWGIPLSRLRNEDPLVFAFSIGNAF